MADQTFPIGGTLDLTPPRIARKTFLEWLLEWATTVDHKRLGLLYLAYAVLFLLVGGAEAIAIRIQLAFPNNHFLAPDTFNRLFTM
ncbi:MAG: cytochrome ubiquinol oxidase subunit I, partial [Acidobacteriaceae bacterium]